jgi:hypothetical protein
MSEHDVSEAKQNQEQEVKIKKKPGRKPGFKSVKVLHKLREDVSISNNDNIIRFVDKTCEALNQRLNNERDPRRAFALGIASEILISEANRFRS